jgi:hypothetical protein
MSLPSSSFFYTFHLFICIDVFPHVMPSIFNNGRSHVKINYVLQIIFYYSVYYLCLFAWCPTHIVLCFFFYHLVYPMMPCYSGFPFLIAPSVFSNVYIRPVSCVPVIDSYFEFSIFDCPFVFSNVYIRPVSCVPDLASYSGYSIFGCPFGFL